MNHVIEKIRIAELEKWKGDLKRADPKIAARIAKFAGASIVGLDFNPELVKATKMNMVMNNDGAGGLFQANSLASSATWDEDLRERNLLGKVDLIFTNPPFGSKIPVDDPSILEKFDLGHSWSYDENRDEWSKRPVFRSHSLQKSSSLSVAFSFLSRVQVASLWFCRMAFSDRPALDMSGNGFWRTPKFWLRLICIPTLSSQM
jgi:type I restriction enzyme M protein